MGSPALLLGDTQLSTWTSFDQRISKSDIDSTPTSDDYVPDVLQAVSKVLGVSTIEIDQAADGTTFVKLGGDSLSAILISAECERKGISIPASFFLRVASVKAILKEIASEAKPLAVPLTTKPLPVSLDISEEPHHDVVLSCQDDILTVDDLLGRLDANEWTELQLLLLRETADNRRRNILTLYQHYPDPCQVEDVCKAWEDTILAEPIFQNLLLDMKVSAEQLLSRKVIQVGTEDDHQREAYAAAHACDSISRLTIITSARPSLSGPRSTAVIWRIHHAFMDGYSARIFVHKVDRTLRGERVAAGGPCFRETVRFLQMMQKERRETTESFWQDKSKKYPSASGKLVLSPQRTAKMTESKPQRSFAIEVPEKQMAAATAQTGLTSTVYFAAAWSLTLAKFMDLDQVCFGLVLSGRDLPIPGAYNVIGPLINILPLLVRVPTKSDGDINLEEFLGRIHDGMLELSNMQHSPVPEGANMQFDTILATQFGYDGVEGLPPGQMPVDQHRLDMQSGIPLSLVLEQRCCLRAFYSPDHYKEEDMNNVRSVFQHTLNRLLLDGSRERLVSAISDALPTDLEERIRQWSNCASSETLDQSKDDDLVTLFENVVARYPNDIALIRGEEKMSYNELDLAAAVIARKLSWIEPNEAVCVYADQSINWIVAIFGVLKAGGVYAPLDPSAPVSIQQANFIRSGARSVIYPSQAVASGSSGPMSEGEAPSMPLPCLVLAVDKLLVAEGIRSCCGCLSLYPRRRIARPDDLAYICFTSGSTGKPKGVQCTHKGLVAFQKDPVVRLGASRGVVVARLMSPVFDGSIHEIFSALTYGATLRLASSLANDDPFSHLQDSDSAIMTPSVAKALNPDRSCELYNMYGPTETTCGATIKRLLPNEPVTLGRANPSTRVYILDRKRQLLPPGAVGEMYLAGIQVSRGYIGLPELNASSFMDDHILPGSQQKMYGTGDYAYWDSKSGEICILGRKDRQIKLRGFRLDLDDLEARAAKAIPESRAVAMFLHDDHLIAAYEASSALAGDISEASLKARMGDVLPLYAMPRRIVALAKFPLTPAGKLN
ncbi:hypothetical protein PG991_013272 [Apiospora marii]|uniref:Carrier domain-containing protein n=1 Tax=Apiospora marii TaxID=335849 RepID=A0ABR1R6E7_9PEZI